MKSVRGLWDQLGGKFGVLMCLAGFLVLFMGWNGAASHDRVPAQFPYLISGGLVGLSLVVIGAAMLVVDGHRRGADDLRAAVAELRDAIEATGVTPNGQRPALAAGMVVAGAASYHRPECHLVDGRETARILSFAEAEADGLAPCRICNPKAAPAARAAKSRSR